MKINTWNHIKEISSIDAQTIRTLNKLQRCCVCGAKATHSIYYKNSNQFLGSFVGLCNNPTRKDI